MKPASFGIWRIECLKRRAQVNSNCSALFTFISAVAIFTSNDIVVLTFTPFVCYHAKNAKINPVPYLVSVFAAANTCSMLLIIGILQTFILLRQTALIFSDA